MKRVLNILLLILATAVVTNAKAEQKSVIHLKNGSTIYGNIIVQQPGKVITISADSATFIVESNHLVSKSSKNIKYEDLSREWKRWSLESKALKGNANGRYLELFSIRTKNYSFSNVVMLGTVSDRKSKYYNASPDTYKIKWDDVKEITKAYQPTNDRNYLDDEVTTSNGKTYQGTIISQQVGVQLTIKTSKGTIVMPLKEVVETRKVTHKGSAKVQDIVTYKNIVVLKNSTNKEGVILAQHYGVKPEEKYITLLYSSGNTEKIMVDNIVEYRTVYNENDAKIYKNGYLYVNEFVVKKAETKTEGANRLYIDKKIFSLPEGVVVTFKSQVSKTSNNWSLIALESLRLEDGGYTQGYNEEVLKHNTITPSSVENMNGLNVVSFNYLSPGYYGWVNLSTKDTYIIKIVK